ncbi:hypothetical protein D3C80_1939230 [compost metagenome]
MTVCQSPPSGLSSLSLATSPEKDIDRLMRSFSAKAVPSPYCHQLPSLILPGTLTPCCEEMSSKDSSKL